VNDRAGTQGADVISWLLEGDDPSVRYFTLTELLGCAPGDAEMVAARLVIMNHGPLPRVLAAQTDDGHWEVPRTERLVGFEAGPAPASEPLVQRAGAATPGSHRRCPG
jgi:hypothetical protein